MSGRWTSTSARASKVWFVTVTYWNTGIARVRDIDIDDHGRR